MNFQEIIVWLIVGLCAAYAGRRIYMTISGIRHNKTDCSHGCEGCALKNSHCSTAKKGTERQKK